VGYAFLSFLLSQKNIGGQENEAQEPQINEIGRKRVYHSETGEWLGTNVSLQYLGFGSITVTIEEDWSPQRSIVVQPSEIFVVYVSRYGSSIVRYGALRMLVLLP
ncbi:hypothetical protein MUP01_11090, partial [Candidatus Bathyarchaeota archaeon]|nr:hypothetical protein [Candidatus Bathyarchaeota archaeon]